MTKSTNSTVTRVFLLNVRDLLRQHLWSGTPLQVIEFSYFIRLICEKL